MLYFHLFYCIIIYMKTIKIIIILLILVIIYIYLRSLTYIDASLIFKYVCNNKINIINKEKLDILKSDEKIMIMANHVNVIDYFVVLYCVKDYLNKKKLFTVVTYDLLDMFKNVDTQNYLYYNLFNFIKYDRYCEVHKKEDINHPYHGRNVIKKILNEYDNNNISLIFPSGNCAENGKHTEFRPGCFKMCALNNIKILPLTILYKVLIPEDDTSFTRYFNNDVTVIVHDTIEGNDFHSLREKTLSTIMEPLNN